MYGVDCSYDKAKASLQMSAQGSFQVQFSPPASRERAIDCNAAASQDWSYQSTSQELHHNRNNIGVCRSGHGVHGVSWSNQGHSVQYALPGTSFWPESFSTPFSTLSVNPAMSSMIDDSMQLELSAANLQPDSESVWSPSTSFWHFSEAHLEILARFRVRTALTIGDKTLAPAYRDLLCHLAMTVSLPYSCLCIQVTNHLAAPFLNAHAHQPDTYARR
jgi:hypothetical protein